MGRLPDNYVGPKARILMLKKDHPGVKSAVLTNAVMQQVGDALCVLIKASIEIDGKVVAEGHAFTDSPEDDKSVEKAETTAIGRALVNAGYPELEDSVPEEEEPKKAKPADVKSSRGGLGLVKTTKPKDEVKDEETEDSDEESEEEVAEEPKPAKKPSGLVSGLKGGKAKAAEVEEETDVDEENEGTEVEDDEEEEEDTEVKPAPAARYSREELLKKYAKK